MDEDSQHQGTELNSDSNLDTAAFAPFQSPVPEQWIESFGRCQNLEFLGKGGMANVLRSRYSH